LRRKGKSGCVWVIRLKRKDESGFVWVVLKRKDGSGWV
jgi:hypothetical protein